MGNRLAIMTAVLALALAGCGQKVKDTRKSAGAETGGTAEEIEVTDYAKLSGYPKGWYVSPGWPGEYPPGFAVLDEDVKLTGRARPNVNSPADQACSLPRFANYQLWNSERVAADQLEFFVATRTFPITLNTDTSIDYAGDGAPGTLALKTGDQLIFLRYLGEGYSVLSFKGKEYDINIAELSDISDLDENVPEEDLWVRVKCTGGARAWLLYDDVITEPGFAPSPITNYGKAADLTPEETEAARFQLNDQDQLIEPAGAPQ